MWLSSCGKWPSQSGAAICGSSRFWHFYHALHRKYPRAKFSSDKSLLTPCVLLSSSITMHITLILFKWSVWPGLTKFLWQFSGKCLAFDNFFFWSDLSTMAGHQPKYLTLKVRSTIHVSPISITASLAATSSCIQFEWSKSATISMIFFPYGLAKNQLIGGKCHTEAVTTTHAQAPHAEAYLRERGGIAGLWLIEKLPLASDKTNSNCYMHSKESNATGNSRYPSALHTVGTFLYRPRSSVFESDTYTVLYFYLCAKPKKMKPKQIQILAVLARCTALAMNNS